MSKEVGRQYWTKTKEHGSCFLAYVGEALASRGCKRTLLQFLSCLACAAMLTGCGHVGYKPRGFEVPAANSTSSAATATSTYTTVSAPAARKIVIFFDGTANDEGSDTNVKRLHSLITLKNRDDIASLYILGVGTNFDSVGAITGAGINARVKLAYEFILDHYQPPDGTTLADEIYIFGFSRGAFTARILATMLNFAGIVKEWPAQNNIRRYTPKELADLVHKATFPGYGQGNADRTPNRPVKLKHDLNALGLESVVNKETGDIAVPVKVLGLWDTVEALGLPPVIDNLRVRFLSQPPVINLDEPNPRYGEKLCNVERAYHALSIDDNRATIFTPLLLSRAHMFKGCLPGKGMLDGKGNIKNEALQEVWFSGAHSDVGGGYSTGDLSGLSLNWMLNRLRCTQLLSTDVCKVSEEKDFDDLKYVRDDFLSGSHDPTTGLWSFYPKVSRDLFALATDKASIWRRSPAPICVHRSVPKRRALIEPRPQEYDQLSFEKVGLVHLAPAAYGKGRSWTWLREIKDAQFPVAQESVDIQVYPQCHFNQGTTSLEGVK